LESKYKHSSTVPRESKTSPASHRVLPYPITCLLQAIVLVHARRKASPPPLRHGQIISLLTHPFSASRRALCFSSSANIRVHFSSLKRLVPQQLRHGSINGIPLENITHFAPCSANLAQHLPAKTHASSGTFGVFHRITTAQRGECHCLSFV
jgi:hypothetical protein